MMVTRRAAVARITREMNADRPTDVVPAGKVRRETFSDIVNRPVLRRLCPGQRTLARRASHRGLERAHERPFCGRRAFTLLELLTVIGILGLLISIIIPSLTAARRTAKTNVCRSHLKGIGNAFALYLTENDDRFPPVRMDKLSPTDEDYYVNGDKRLRPRWQWFLQTDQGPVINPAPFRHAFRSPGYFHDDTVPRGSNEVRNGRTMTIDVFTCPELDDPAISHDIRDGAYGYNYQYLGNTRQDTDPKRWDNFPVGLHQIRSPSHTVEVADSRGAGIPHGKISYMLDPPRRAAERNAQRFGPVIRPSDPEAVSGVIIENEDSILLYSPVEARHRGLANVVFVDGHAEGMSLSALGYELSDRGSFPTVPDKTPLPIHDPYEGTYHANNRLWNGLGQDPIAEKHRPTSGG
ncbi:MAG: prepilin-type N-terminal cleavage/methylation domain-containing protein [Planctomycetota bacterium]|nr:MAG: prepilin-type N-terminal cleavage/methylation domain-containing protein [Planctomycetota bacterium]